MFFPFAVQSEATFNPFDDAASCRRINMAGPWTGEGSRRSEPSSGPFIFARVVKLTRVNAGSREIAIRQLLRRHPRNRQWEAVKPPVIVPARALSCRVTTRKPWDAEFTSDSLAAPFDGLVSGKRASGRTHGASEVISAARGRVVSRKAGTHAKVETTAHRLRHASIWTLQNSGKQGTNAEHDSEQGKALPCSESWETGCFRV